MLKEKKSNTQPPQLLPKPLQLLLSPIRAPRAGPSVLQLRFPSNFS